MKKSFIKNSLIAILLTFLIALTAVGCGPDNTDAPDTPDVPVDPVAVDLTALGEEIALEITEQGDYTADSYNSYKSKLREAKALFNNAEATQEAVDAMTAALTEARLSLTVRRVVAVAGADKTLELEDGETVEIVLSDFVNTSGLSKITYEVKSSSDVLSFSSVSGGKFTVTAGEVDSVAFATVTITVFYNGENACQVEITAQVGGKTNSVPGLVPDDNVDTDW